LGPRLADYEGNRLQRYTFAMVKFYSQNYQYDYPFATVSLAYFLRYPNPFSRHVLSTDVLHREYDPVTQRLYTTRLHLKRSRLPSAVLKILPRSLLGGSASGESQSYILEKSIVDVKQGWMKTESRNLDFTSVLDVIERQTYTELDSSTPQSRQDKTHVSTVVTLHSRFGQRFKRARPADSSSEEDSLPKQGLLARWSHASLQRSIEAIGLNRTTKSQPNAKEGMMIVLERLRQGGIVAVLEGMARDRDAAYAAAPRT